MTAVTFRALSLSLLLILGADLAHAKASLYDRLGAEAGVAAISNQLIDKTAADPVRGRSFKETNLKHIKAMLSEQICELSGGPCHYSGDTMQQSHAGHHISEAEFYGMVEDLRSILKQRHVGIGATNELLRLLAPMKRDIVEAPATAAGK